MRSKRKKLSEFTLTIVSLIAVAAINYAIVHNSLLFISLAVLIAHELGHYFVARRYHADPSLPIFLPLPFLLIAATKIKQVDRQTRRKIACAGPCAGAFSVAILLLFTIALGAAVDLLIFLVILLITEIVFNFFGSDGRRFRAA
jgi:hypothetical protein